MDSIAPASDQAINAAFDGWLEAQRAFHAESESDMLCERLSDRADAAALAVMHSPTSSARGMAIKAFVLAHAHHSNAPVGSSGLFPLALPEPVTFENRIWQPLVDQACALVPELAAARAEVMGAMFVPRSRTRAAA